MSLSSCNSDFLAVKMIRSLFRFIRTINSLRFVEEWKKVHSCSRVVETCCRFHLGSCWSERYSELISWRCYHRNVAYLWEKLECIACEIKHFRSSFPFSASTATITKRKYPRRYVLAGFGRCSSGFTSWILRTTSVASVPDFPVLG